MRARDADWRRLVRTIGFGARFAVRAFFLGAAFVGLFAAFALVFFFWRLFGRLAFGHFRPQLTF
ncbi:MAG: hypothetical protein WDM89_21835 [Rhizomicrobium sp.]